MTLDTDEMHCRALSFEAFAVFIQELEAVAGTGVASRRFSDDRMMCYTRSSHLCRGALGIHVINFADIDVKPEHRGQLHLTGLLENLANKPARFKATHFYFENVANPRLGDWLIRKGFECVEGIHGQIASYCRRIDPGYVAE